MTGIEQPTSTVGMAIEATGEAKLPPRWISHPWIRALKTWSGALAAGWLILVVLVAGLAPWIAGHPPGQQDLGNALAPFSLEHPLGTDDLGRDVLSRLMYGAQISLAVSVQVVVLALLGAIPIGLYAGYKGGRADRLLMRFMDAGLSFPALVLALAVVSVLGPGVTNAAIALAIVFMPLLARLVRAQTLAVKEESFIEASQSLGTRPFLIVVRRILPNLASALIVQAAIVMSGALIAEATLSFLGLGAQPPAPSWGGMLQQAYASALFINPLSLVPPGLAIALTVVAFNGFGDALTTAYGLDRTKAKRRHLPRRARGRRGFTAIDRPAAVPGAEPAGSNICLRVRGLNVAVQTPNGTVPVVEDVNLTVGQGEIVGLVGESGSGKTVTSLSIMRLAPSPPFVITGGVIELGGRDLFAMNYKELRRTRGSEIAMIFQDPMSSLNPSQTVGAQIGESLRLHRGLSRKQATARAVEMLERVGIPDPVNRARSYPHELSGGMRQRVMIAMALSCSPRLIIADEPTTALDVTIQAQVLDLLRKLAVEDGVAVIFVTHDLAVVSELCDSVAVMYAGQVVERARTVDLFRSPQHPYTQGLIAASRRGEGEEPEPIPGQVPRIGLVPSGCRFAPRCPFAVEECRQSPQILEPVLSVVTTETSPEDARMARCRRKNELQLEGVR
ncbi:dipeptide/oligopeptide/nickel ABC transporter permease/ATP-binding protein [Arthrobacter sp. D1-29]